MEQLSQFSTAERHTVAVDLYTEIKPFVGAVGADEMLCAAEALQARRWGLVYRGLSQFTDRQFATVFMAEHWLRGRVEQIRGGSPVGEVLAEKRCGAIERFILDTLSFEIGEVVQLHAADALQPKSVVDSIRRAA
jgi:hypothetical protein